MPARSSECQKLVLLVRQQLPGEARVTEPKMLIVRVTGADVVSRYFWGLNRQQQALWELRETRSVLRSFPSAEPRAA